MVADLVVNTRSWITNEDCLKASGLVLIILRLVDRNTKPNLPSLAAAILKAKDVVKAYFKDNGCDYMPIWKILDERWTKHLKSPLFKAAAFPNPKVYYKLKKLAILGTESYDLSVQSFLLIVVLPTMTLTHMKRLLRIAWRG